MSIEVTTLKDASGFPNVITVKKAGRTLILTVENENRFKIKGVFDRELVRIATDIFNSSRNINVPEISVLKLLEAGDRINAYVTFDGAATVVAYTVPANKVFYLLSYDLNAFPIVAGTKIEAAFFYGVNNDFANLRAQTGVTHAHTQNAFSNLRLKAGTQLQAYADANTTVNASFQGVEIDA